MNLLTIFVHVGLEALGEAAGAALVAVRLVDRAAPLHVAARLARVHAVAMDRPLEEPRTPCDKYVERLINKKNFISETAIFLLNKNCNFFAA